MLIKFDQIKSIEDFYNQYFDHDEQIHLDLEINDNELQQLVEQIHRRSVETRLMQERQEYF